MKPFAWVWKHKNSGASGVYFEDPAEFGIDVNNPTYAWARVLRIGTLEEERATFENDIYAEAFVRSVRFDPAKPFATVTAPPKAELFRRSPERPEDYADEHISAMWFAWRVCKGLVE